MTHMSLVLYCFLAMAVQAVAQIVAQTAFRELDLPTVSTVTCNCAHCHFNVRLLCPNNPDRSGVQRQLISWN